MIAEAFSAIDLIRNPELLNRNTIPVLREAIRQNPFHQTLYLLLLQNLYKVHDPQFGSVLKKFAPMVADRAVLFDMVEGMNYNIPLQRLENDGVATDGDRTLWLIDNFLKGIPDNSENKVAKSENVDPQADYSAYLEQLPDYDTESAQPVSNLAKAVSVSAQPISVPAQGILVKEDDNSTEIVDNPAAEVSNLAKMPDNSPSEPDNISNELDNTSDEFSNTPDELNNTSNEFEDTLNELDNLADEGEFTVSALRKNIAEADDQPIANDISEIAQNEEFYTEAMAGIYIKQQKFAQALEIIKVISAANPKKSVYFAEQIRYLELLKRIMERKKQ